MERVWHKIIVAAALLLVAYAAARGVAAMETGANLPWYHSSDEVVVAAEVIRFADLNYAQDFFDMPGTPLMLLGAVEWRARWKMAGEPQPIHDFSFAHLDELMRMLRWTSLTFYALSGFLLFLIGWRLMGPAPGALAAALLLASPVYAGTAVTLRVEPMSMCFALAAVLAAMAIPDTLAAATLAGLAAGIAAGARLHSVTMTLPLLAILLWRRTWKQQATYSPRVARAFAYLAIAGCAAAVVLAIHWQTSTAPSAVRLPYAYALLRSACIAAAIAIAAPGSLYFAGKARPVVVKLVTPAMVLLAIGVAAGFALSVPTVFGQFSTFLRSLNFYSGSAYRDAIAHSQPLAEQYRSLFAFYLQRIAPDTTVAVLLVAGAVLAIAVPRWRILLPFLLSGVLFFFSKAPDLQRAPHHVALWIPCYALLCALPLAAGIAAVERRRPWMGVAGVAAAIGIAVSVVNGPGQLHFVSLQHAERLQAVAEARAWAATNIDQAASIDTAFYCFGPEIFYNWFEQAHVAPPVVTDRYRIWWGQRSKLGKRAGFACLTPQDSLSMQEWELKEKGEGLNPEKDARFQRLAQFGKGPYQVQLYRYDLR